MAWNAERKRRRWWCVNGWNAIAWYDEYLYIKWWDQLTDEEQQNVIEYEKQRQKHEKEEARQVLMRMKLIVDTIYNCK